MAYHISQDLKMTLPIPKGTYRAPIKNPDMCILYCNLVGYITRVIKSRRMRLAGHVTQMGEKRNACKVLVGKSERRGQLSRSRHRGEKILE
jgi:hypothetical protein